MTSPQHAQDGASGRTYSIPGFPDIDFISVTNICGCLNKPALPPWSAKLVAERAVNEEARWHAIQQEEGDAAAIAFLKAAPREYTKAAAERGSAVHHLCEHWPCDPGDYTGYMQSYEKWLHDYEPEFLAQELTVCNPAEGYAGTLDAIATINYRPGDSSIRRLADVDYKTGNCYPESHALQLAAYRHATHMVVNGETVPLEWHTETAGVVEIKPKSYKYHPLRTDAYVFEAFLNAKRLWWWQQHFSKTAKGLAWA